MRRILLLTICLLLAALHAHADPVDVNAARQKAAEFLQGQKAKGARRRAPAARQLTVAATGPADSYYIFNAKDGQGYVVVSGEDATEDILGYSNTGTIDTTSMPCGMKMLLEGYADQIHYLRSHGITREQNKAPKNNYSGKFHVSASRCSQFGQGNKEDLDSPYNWYCPSYDGNDNHHCVTGCVATAMAGLMYAYQWPSAITTEIPAYNTRTLGLSIPAIAANTTIDWSKILQTYTYSGIIFDTPDFNEEQGREIAKLMKMAGTSVRMDYNKSSGAQDPSVPYALKQYFGYENAVYENASSYKSSSAWYEKLRNEIANDRPVYYRGSAERGNHAFLLEGYDGDKFDVNFGWNGEHNDCFLLNVIKGEFDFINNQGAIFNVKPKSVLTSSKVPPRLWTEYFSLKDPNGIGTFQKSEETGVFNIQISLFVKNYVPLEKVNYDCFIAVGSALLPTSICTNLEFKYLDVGPVDATIPFENVTDGKYKVALKSTEAGSGNLDYNDNSQHEYAEVCVCGDWMSIKQTTYDNTNFTAIDIEQAESLLRVGTEATFNCRVFNSGTSPKYYDGGMLVSVAWTDYNGIEQNKVVQIDRLTFTGNGATDYTFKFIPFVQGEQAIKILNKRWEVVGSKTINVSYSSTSFDMLEVTEMTLSTGDVDRGLIDGTTLRGKLYIKNNDIVPKKDDIIIGLEDIESPQANRTKLTAVTIAPNATAAYNFSFGNLTAGHHYVVTASYASGEEFFRSEELLCTTDGTGDVEPTNGSLVAYEYWFDNNYAGHQRVSMSGNKAVIRESINTDHLPVGLHFLNFRVQRDNDIYGWSGISTSPFMKLGHGTEASLDYWIDDDYTNLVNLPLSESEDEQLLTFNLSSYSVGLHQLCYQVKLPGSMPSAVQRAAVMKLPMGVAPNMQYWFDEDIAHPQTLTNGTVDATGGYIFVNTLDLKSLSVGPHRINFRATGSNGLKRSSVMSVNVVKMPLGKGDRLEYWYDDDEANAITLSGVSEGDCIVYESQLNMNSLPVGLHRLNLRAISNGGQLKSSPVTCYVMRNVTGSISCLEYWFDDDRDNVHTLSGHAAEAGEPGYIFKGDLDISGLRPGHHRLHYRGIGSDGQLSTATGSASILVKLDANGDATMASYSISVDGGIPIAQGPLSARADVTFSYVLDAKDLDKGWHTLQTTFWNSYGISVSEETSFEVIFGDDDAVNSPQAEDEDDGPIYNLSGMRVNSNAKGILIKNGKKYIVK